MPNGNYFLTVSTSESIKSAQLTSCTIDCSDYDVDISFRYWISRNVQLEICMRLIEQFDKLMHCQSVPRSLSNGKNKVEVTLPPAEFFNIVIVVKNMSYDSVAILDDIQVISLPCATSTSAATQETPIFLPTTTSIKPPRAVLDPTDKAALCSSIVCDFEKNLCSYVNAVGAKKRWEVERDDYRNRFSLVTGAGEGLAYAATKMLPGESSVLESVLFLSDNEYVIRLLVYKSSDDVELRVCCSNLTQCPYWTKNELHSIVDNGNWNEAFLICPSATTKILFSAVNSGSNEGSIAIDDVQLLNSPKSGLAARRARKNACI